MPQPEPEDADAEDHKEPKPVTVHVNAKPVSLPSHKVTGEEIKMAAIDQGVEIQLDFELIEEAHGDKKERKIGDNEEITVNDQAVFLARPRVFKIVVNTKEKEVSETELTFDKVVELAQPLPSGPNYEYTVDYRKAAGEKHKGELMPGETVEIKDGTIFDVTPTDKS
jgi:hypothetical protein